jgi:GntR family transcriptional regulator
MDQGPGIGLRPLYLQVRERLVRRLIDGDWQPGDLIPSEIQLAADYQVSQGTVRKAIDTMVRENLLRRRQGRGTFVATSDDDRFVFQFFRLQPDAGDRVQPSSRVLSVGRTTAPPGVAPALGLKPGSDVVRIRRVRLLAGQAALVERIFLDARRFKDFPAARETPNNLYDLYSRHWGITIGRTEERLKAVAADADEARHLGCTPGAPLLQIERVARDLEDAPTEYRLSRCLTERFHYFNQLS